MGCIINFNLYSHHPLVPYVLRGFEMIQYATYDVIVYAK